MVEFVIEFSSAGCRGADLAECIQQKHPLVRIPYNFGQRSQILLIFLAALAYRYLSGKCSDNAVVDADGDGSGLGKTFSGVPARIPEPGRVGQPVGMKTAKWFRSLCTIPFQIYQSDYIGVQMLGTARDYKIEDPVQGEKLV